MEQGAGSVMAGKLFRFQDLEIWKKAIEIGNKLLDIADGEEAWSREQGSRSKAPYDR